MSDERAISRVDPTSLTITKVNTGNLLNSLQSLFDTVTSGEQYNVDQVKAATGLSNAMLKVLRFEFDVYKHFKGRTTT